MKEYTWEEIYDILPQSTGAFVRIKVQDWDFWYGFVVPASSYHMYIYCNKSLAELLENFTDIHTAPSCDVRAFTQERLTFV